MLYNISMENKSTETVDLTIKNRREGKFLSFIRSLNLLDKSLFSQEIDKKQSNQGFSPYIRLPRCFLTANIRL